MFQNKMTEVKHYVHEVLQDLAGLRRPGVLVEDLREVVGNRIDELLVMEEGYRGLGLARDWQRRLFSIVDDWMHKNIPTSPDVAAFAERNVPETHISGTGGVPWLTPATHRSRIKGLEEMTPDLTHPSVHPAKPGVTPKKTTGHAFPEGIL